jgi:hypothetical protein
MSANNSYALQPTYPSALNILFFGREKTPKAISPTILYWGDGGVGEETGRVLGVEQKIV